LKCQGCRSAPEKIAGSAVVLLPNFKKAYHAELWDMPQGDETSVWDASKLGTYHQLVAGTSDLLVLLLNSWLLRYAQAPHHGSIVESPHRCNPCLCTFRFSVQCN
jgi:hypothetical protein